MAAFVRLPVGPHVVQVGLHGGQLGLQGRQPLLRRRVLLLRQRHPLQFQLRHPPVRHVHLGGHGVHLHAEHAGRLVHEVRWPCRAGIDPTRSGPTAPPPPPAPRRRCAPRGAPRSAPAAPAGWRWCPPPWASPTSTGWKRRSRAASVSMWVRYSSSVVAPIMCRVAPRQRRLQHVGGVPWPPRPCRPPTTMCISSMNVMMRPPDANDLGQHGLQPLLELAPQRRAGHHGGDVQGDDLPVGEGAGHVPGGDALRQPSPRSPVLPTPGLADEDRVVLGAPRQDLHGAADLIVPPDHRIQPILPSSKPSGSRPKTSRALGAS